MAEAQRTFDEDILQCPLCCCIYDNPRQLPCLHSFCLKCLQNHISPLSYSNYDTVTERINECKESRSHMCPVCRTVFAISQELDPLEYVRRLPSNNVLSMLIQQDKFEQKHNFCDLCFKSDKKAKAEFYCLDCKMAFCIVCENCHKKFPSISNHTTLPQDATINRSFVPGSNLFCEDHTHLKLDFFCSSHQRPCCKLCVKLYHTQCKDVRAFRKALNDIDKTGEISNLSHCFDELISMYVEIKKDRHENIVRLTNETRVTNDRIELLGNSIIEHFKTLMQTMKNENECLLSKSVSKLDQQVSEIDHSLKSAINIKTLLNACSNHSSNIQILQQLDKISHSCKEQQGSLTECRKQLFSIEHKVNFKCRIEDVQAQQRELGSLKLKEAIIPSISIYTEMKRTLSIVIPAEQNRGSSQYLTQNIFGSRHAKITFITGAVFHSSGNIIFANNSENAIHIHDSKGSLLLKQMLNYKPFDLAVLDDDMLAISFPEECQIMKFSLKYRQLQGWKTTLESCYGIHVTRDKLFASCITHIEIFSTISNTQHMIQKVKSTQGYLYVPPDLDEIYYTVENRLVCVSSDGKEICHHNSDNRSLVGVTMGADGYIYAADTTNKTVIMFSKTLVQLQAYPVDFIPSALVFLKGNKRLCISRMQKGEVRGIIQDCYKQTLIECASLFELV